MQEAILFGLAVGFIMGWVARMKLVDKVEDAEARE